MRANVGVLAALAAIGATATYAGHHAAAPVWMGRKRPSSKGGISAGPWVADGKKHAPKGYAFNGRGDLINTRKRAKYGRAEAR